MYENRKAGMRKVYNEVYKLEASNCQQVKLETHLRKLKEATKKLP
jgi:hypothetical protein